MWPSLARIERGSERGLVLVLFAHNFYLLLNWPIVLMFAFSEKSTVKSLEGSSDIFGNGRTSSLVFGNLRWSSGIFGSLRKPSEINCRKMHGRKLLDILNKPFLLLSGKYLLLQRIFLLLELKCLKFNYFMLRSQKVLSRWGTPIQTPLRSSRFPVCEVRGLNQERFLKLAKVLTLDIVLTIKAHFWTLKDGTLQSGKKMFTPTSFSNLHKSRYRQKK